LSADVNGKTHGVTLRQQCKTLGDIVAAWGEPTRTASYGSDDFVVAYDTCFDASPVVIKLDQTDQPRGRGAPLAYPAPVTGVLIGYADEPAGGPACG